MKVQVEGVDYEKLPPAPEKILLYRSKVTNNFTGRMISTEYALRVGESYIKVLCQHDKKSTTTSLITGKRKEIKKGKKLLNREQYPISLVIPEFSVKLSLDLDEEGKEFLLLVNGRSIYALPYFYDFTESEQRTINLKASIYLNEKTITVPQPWTPIDFIDNIRATFSGEDKVQIQKACIKSVECGYAGPLNEAIDAIVEFSHESTGLTNLDFTEFPARCFFDPHLLQRLVKKTTNIQQLTFYNLFVEN